MCCTAGLKVKCSQLKGRVEHAYYNYGRFCSAHPSSCITISIITIAFLSCPLVVHLKIGANSPADIFRSNNSVLLHKEQYPEWFLQKPAVYIQHIILQARASSQKNSTLSQEQVVKKLLYPSFTLYKVLSEFARNNQSGFSCFHISKNGKEQFKGLPPNGCLILSPSLFWSNSESVFHRDKDVRKTVMTSYCVSSFCPRDLLLGIPLPSTKMKKAFESITYGFTIFAVHVTNTTAAELKTWILQKIPLLKLASYNGSSLTHIYYRPRKYFASFLPLLSSYILLLFYLYFSVSKIIMVKSKLGLALAAVFTVAATSAMTAGICTHFNIMPTLWGAELFPYLALVVGLENTLCLTRSVVYTPPAMDVQSRIAHGLSQEGYAFTKYFVLEMGFLFIGFLTFVPEIQEFCIFGWIGLIIDFYMQLFFYAPCLTFDLLRLDPEEKQRFASMLFYSGIRQYKNYVNPRCPFVRIWPGFFKKTKKLFRVKSESQVQINTRETEIRKLKGHRRTISYLTSDNVLPRPFIRVRLLYYWTRTRIVHRVVMVVFVLWALWIGLIVQDWRSSNTAVGKISSSGRNESMNSIRASNNHNNLVGQESQPYESVSYWMDVRSKMFCWWPSLLGKNNLSVSGRYITILPDVFFDFVIRIDEPEEFASVSSKVRDRYASNAQDYSLSQAEYRLMSRISILETKMAVILVISTVFLVATVWTFLIYVCFWERNQKDESRLNEELATFKERCTRRLPEAKPVLSAEHNLPIECISIVDYNHIATSCFEGQAYMWDITTGECVKSNELPQIWSMVARQLLLLIGCSDGTLEIANAENGSMVMVYRKHQKSSGIVRILTPGLRVILVRLDNSIDFLDITVLPNKVCRIDEITSVPPHYTRIIHSAVTLFCLVTVTQDRYIQIYGIRSANFLHNIKPQDNGAIISICVDQIINIIYTSCESGVIYVWDLENGKLVRTIDGVSSSNEIVELECTPSMLLGYSSDGHLWIWDKCTGQLNTRITPDPSLTKEQFGKRCLVLVNNQIAVTSFGDTVLFWDLNYKVVAKKVYIEGPVSKLVPLNNAVLCCVAQRIYRIDVPVMRYG